MTRCAGSFFPSTTETGERRFQICCAKGRITVEAPLSIAFDDMKGIIDVAAMAAVASSLRYASRHTRRKLPELGREVATAPRNLPPVSLMI
jgi:hypothetical protein